MSAALRDIQAVNRFNRGKKVLRLRIRRNDQIGPDSEAWLGRGGQWTSWTKAAVFSSHAALEAFARAEGHDIYGVFE